MSSMKRMMQRQGYENFECGNYILERTLQRPNNRPNINDKNKNKDVFNFNTKNLFIQRMKDSFPEFTSNKMSTHSFISYRGNKKNNIIEKSPKFALLNNQIKNMFQAKGI